MELNECKDILTRLFDGKYSRRDVLLCPNLTSIKNLLGFEYEDVCLIVKNRPDILFLEDEDFSSNAKEYAKNFNVFSREFKNLVLKFPAILTMRCCIFQYKITQIAKIFDISTIDSMKLMYFYPAFLTLKKDYVKKQIEMLGSFFNEDSLYLRKILRVEPRLIFASQKSIQKIKDFLKNLGLNESEVCVILREVPSLVFLRESELSFSVQKLYPAHFNKRELNEVLLKCPYLLLFEDEFELSLDAIEKTFDGESAKIIRKAPQIFYNFEDFYRLASDLSVSKNYIASYPEIFNEPYISLKIKLILSRVMGLDRDFEKVLAIPVNLLSSRFLFMQYYGIFEYQNVLLDEGTFESKYAINSQNLLRDFTFDVKTLSRTIEFFASKNECNMADIDLSQILSYLDTKPKVESTYTSNSLRCGIFDKLISLNFSRAEAFYIISVCPSIVDYDEGNVTKVYEEFLRLGLTNEEFLKLIISHPSLLCASFSDIQNIFSSKFEIKDGAIGRIEYNL